MAINDYLQGKKSAAEIDKIIKMTDYKGNVNLTNQLKLIELKRGNIAERINEATVSKGLPASVGAIKSILREEGKEITTIPKGKEGTWSATKEDEGNYNIEEATKTDPVYYLENNIRRQFPNFNIFNSYVGTLFSLYIENSDLYAASLVFAFLLLTSVVSCSLFIVLFLPSTVTT